MQTSPLPARSPHGSRRFPSLLATATVCCALTASVAAAAVPVTNRFDLAAAGQQLMGGTVLQNDTVMQSFVFNNSNGDVYTVQVTETNANGITKTQAAHERDGDLTVTRLSSSGTKLGYMYLQGFGHGVSIGLETSGTTVYLWTEVDSVSDINNVGHGTKVARFKFVSGTTLANTAPISSNFQKYVPASDASTTDPQFSCATDLTTGRIAFRYLLPNGTTRRLKLCTLSAVKAAPYPAAAPSYLSYIKVPAAPIPGSFQGFTTYGSFVYLYYGDSYDDVPAGNTELYSHDWNDATPDTPTLVQEATTAVFGSLSFREPEGMCVQIVGTQTRLSFGFASGAPGARQANFAYKTGWHP